MTFRLFIAKTPMRLILPALALTLVAACGGGHVIDVPPPPAKPAAPPPPPKADAFRDFGGERVVPNEVFRLRAKAKAVAIVEIVISMIRVEWTTREMPDGRKIKEGTAELLVKKGDKKRRFRLEQDEVKTVMGTKIEVKGVGEDYDKSRYDYLPWVDLVVTAK
jgi:hypothetical protein